MVREIAQFVKKGSNMKVARQNTYITLWVQVCFYIISSVIFGLFIYRGSAVFIVHDADPACVPQKIVAERTKDKIHAISMGLFIRNFVQFDIVHNTIVFDGLITAVFDKNRVPLDTVSKFTVESGDITRKSDPVVKTNGSLVTALWDVRISLTPNFNFKGYPLDSHRLDIILSNYAVEPSVIALESSDTNFTMDQHINIPGWNFIDKKVCNGYAYDLIHLDDKHEGNYFPRVIFSIDCKRHDINHLLAVLLPMIGLFFLSMLVFSYSVQDFMDSYMTLAMAMLAYRFVIQATAPDTSYFMLSDYLFLLFLALIFFTFFINILVEYRSSRLKLGTLAAFHILLLACFVYALYIVMGKV